MELSRVRFAFFSVGELVVAVPFFLAATMVWWTLPPSLLSAVLFLGLIELGVGLFFLRTYIRGFPQSLRETAEANTLRLDGSESPRRTSVELHAIRKLRMDLLGSLMLTLIVVNLLMAGCYLVLMQLPAGAEEFEVERYLPAAWTMLFLAAVIACGSGFVMLLRTFHLSMTQYSQSVHKRTEAYAKLDITRMQEEFQEDEIDYATAPADSFRHNPAGGQSG